MLKFAVDKTGSGRRRIEKKGGGGWGWLQWLVMGLQTKVFLMIDRRFIVYGFSSLVQVEFA